MTLLRRKHAWRVAVLLGYTYGTYYGCILLNERYNIMRMQPHGSVPGTAVSMLAPAAGALHAGNVGLQARNLDVSAGPWDSTHRTATPPVSRSRLDASFKINVQVRLVQIAVINNTKRAYV